MRIQPIQLLIFGCLTIALQTIGAAATIATFNDITNWTGSGSQQAALVIDWNDGKNPLTFGYRFDGTVTTEAILQAVVMNDPNLYLRAGSPTQFGLPLYGLGYDRDADGFGIADDNGVEAIFNANGFASTGIPDQFDSAALSVDADDSYYEGWFTTGFWSLYEGTGEPFNGGSWTGANTGISDLNAVNGSWHGLSFALGYVDTPPSPTLTSAVPEPSGTFLLSILTVAAAIARRRNVNR